jgi:hypothetical protein
VSLKKIKYRLHPLSRTQRVLAEHVLLDGVERQGWYSVVYLEMWQSEGCISIQ